MSLLARLAMVLASVTGAFLNSSARAASYLQTNLIADSPATVGAASFDSTLINPWGLAGGSGTELWASIEGSAKTTLYSGFSPGNPFQPYNLMPSVNIPGDQPTGAVLNTSFSDFGNSSFLFASKNGNIDGWKGGASTVVLKTVFGASFTGLAAGGPAGGKSLYAADNANNQIDVFNSSLSTMTTIANPDGLLPGMNLFNVQVIGNKLFATYQQTDFFDSNNIGGAVATFNLNGTNPQILVQGMSMEGDQGGTSTLAGPWGLAIAPSKFGQFAGDLLVGNNDGSGLISAFDPVTGAFHGLLRDAQGNPLAIPGLWGLLFGSGNFGTVNTLFFAAGPGDVHGILGAITAVPEPSSIVLAVCAAVGVAVARYRRRRRA